MPELPRIPRRSHASALSEEVGAQEQRKVRARRVSARGVWSGFGLFGLIGWSVAAPTLLGALLGLWLDKRQPSVHSWTLILLVAGLCLGCANAWRWIAREEKEIRATQEDKE